MRQQAAPERRFEDEVAGVWLSAQFRTGGQSQYVMSARLTLVFYRDGRAEAYFGNELLKSGTWKPESDKEGMYSYRFFEDTGAVSHFVVEYRDGTPAGYLYESDTDREGSRRTDRYYAADEWILFKVSLEPDQYWRHRRAGADAL